MRRREFIAGLGSAAAWPVVARAQQPERVRRIGVLLPAAAVDAEYQARLGAFHQGLALSGWSIGRNVQIDTRWSTANATEVRRQAAELGVLQNAIATGNPVTRKDRAGVAKYLSRLGWNEAAIGAATTAWPSRSRRRRA